MCVVVYVICNHMEVCSQLSALNAKIIKLFAIIKSSQPTEICNRNQVIWIVLHMHINVREMRKSHHHPFASIFIFTDSNT